MDISKIAKQSELYLNYDPEYECHVLDEDRLIDELDDAMKEGGNIVDYHGCEFFPERWFDAVFVLRTDNTMLYQRLEKRNYSQRKIQENVQCEIFQTILDEAKDSYNSEIVYELNSNTPDDLQDNLNRIQLWIDQWTKTFANDTNNNNNNNNNLNRMTDIGHVS
jgi:adenylate kinase